MHLNFTFIKLLPILQNGGVAVWHKVRRLSDLQVAPSLVAPPTFLSAAWQHKPQLDVLKKKLFLFNVLEFFPLHLKMNILLLARTLGSVT